MTEKDLEEFEKEFGFKLLPTSFKKPLSEITKEEYRERIEFLYNAIINDDSNEEDDFLMAEKDLLEKNRFTEEEYKKQIKEQFNQMLEDIEMEEIRKKVEKKSERRHEKA